MKKLIAIAVVFVLVAGAVFADSSVGGQFGYQVEIANGNSGSDDIGAASRARASYANANFGGDTFGGVVRLYAVKAGAGDKNVPYWNLSPFAFAWWKPIDQFKMQIGHNPDGNWGAQVIGGWGYNAEAQDYVAVDEWIEWDTLNGATSIHTFFAARKAGFYPGFNASGLSMSIYPADGVAINIGLPFGGGGHEDGTPLLYKALAKFHLNAGIQIGDAGKLNVSFVGNDGFWDDYKSVGNIYASFYLTQIENLGVDLGIDFPLPYKDTDDKTTSPGMQIGLGVQYGAGDFGVKFRAGLELPKTHDGESNNQTYFGFNVMPYYNFDGMTAFLNAGLGFYSYNKDGDTDTAWFVNPYIKVPAGGINFYAGIQIYGVAYKDDGKDAVSWWSIPLGLQVYF